MITPPTTENELLQRTQDIAGFTIKQLADLHRVSTPETLLHDKGWFGQLLEKQLGATAASKAEPDFHRLVVVYADCTPSNKLRGSYQHRVLIEVPILLIY